jgi:hypothetical protein
MVYVLLPVKLLYWLVGFGGLFVNGVIGIGCSRCDVA